MKYWISCLVGVVAFSFAYAVRAERSASRDALYAYYNRPHDGMPLEVKKQQGAVSVEICADVCDLFSGPVAEGKNDQFWDAILVFKAFVSTSLLDKRFARENSQLAEMLLSRLVNLEKCQSDNDNKSKALCAIRKYSLRTGFEHAKVVYDEGNRCLVYRSFDPQQTMVESRSRCTRLVPRSRETPR